MFGEPTESTPLGDSPGKNVEVASGREEHVAVEVGEPAAHLVHDVRVVEEEGAASLLGHPLALHAGHPTEGANHRLGSDPALVDLPLDRLDRLEPVAVDYSGAHVGD